MSEMPESARRLLIALVEIEDRAIEAARQGGCKCSKPVPEVTDRNYPTMTFTSEAIGKPSDQVPWKMWHEPGCPMDGQEGIG
jgi:hypothetical protein